MMSIVPDLTLSPAVAAGGFVLSATAGQASFNHREFRLSRGFSGEQHLPAASRARWLGVFVSALSSTSDRRSAALGCDKESECL